MRPHFPPPAAPDGAVAQLGERLVRNEEVRGSIPLSSTIRAADGSTSLSLGRPTHHQPAVRGPASTGGMKTLITADDIPVRAPLSGHRLPLMRPPRAEPPMHGSGAAYVGLRHPSSRYAAVWQPPLRRPSRAVGAATILPRPRPRPSTRAVRYRVDGSRLGFLRLTAPR